MEAMQAAGDPVELGVATKLNHLASHGMMEMLLSRSAETPVTSGPWKERYNVKNGGHMYWYLHALKNYATFHGRAQRVEFWTFVLVNLAISTGFEATFGIPSWPERFFHTMLIIPTLAVTIRRLHDSSHSGGWALLYFVPVVGWIGLLVLMLLDSTPYMNAHGPNPKGEDRVVHA